MAATLAELGFDIRTDSIRDATRSLGALERQSASTETAQRGLTNAAKLAAAALSTLGAAQLTSNIYEAVKSAESMKASLKTMTGSIYGANAAWSELVEFAKTTPFTLDQSVNGFIKMKSLGLDPTTEAMKSFGNTASAMNKDLMQMVEAVADAANGQNERLIEFGITSKKMGEQTQFTFQGIKTTVGNSSREIIGYLKSIGDTTFAGAMMEQMDGLKGGASNLEDTIDNLYRKIGDTGGIGFFSASIGGASSAVESITKNLESVTNVVGTLGLVIGARLVTALTASGAAMVANTIASARLASAEAIASQQVVRRTSAELIASEAILARAMADSRAAAGTNAHAFALANLAAISARATAAQVANTAAVNTSAAAMARASISARAMGGAMALIGGPLGVVVTAAAALLYFGTSSDTTAEDAANLQRRIDSLGDSFDKLGKKQAAVAVLDLTESNKKLSGELLIANARAETLNMNISRFGQGSKAAEWREELVRVEGSQEKLGAQIESTAGKIEKLNAIINQKGVKNLGESAKESTQEFIKLSNAITDQFLKLKLGDAAYLQHKLTISGGTEAQIESVLALRSASEAIKTDTKLKQEASDAALEYSDSMDAISQSVRDSLDPLSEFKARSLDALNALNSGKLSAPDYEAYIEKLTKDLGKDAGTNFSKSFDSSTKNIADSLQDSIASGDWSSMGTTVGGALAGGISAAVTDSMAVSMGAIGAGFAGAVAGGLAGLAINKLLGSSNSTPAYVSAQESQGTGTVLGDISEKSGSIANATDITASATSELVGINRSMLDALNSVGEGIENSSSAVARMLAQNAALLQGRPKIVDDGISISGGSISTLASSASVNQASDEIYVKENGDLSIRPTEVGAGEEINDIVTQMFSGIYETVREGAAIFGMSEDAIGSLNVAAADLNFANMSSEEVAAATAAHFGTVFDKLATDAIPWITGFQMAGEGLGETLARVATNVQVTEEAVKQLGFEFASLSGEQLAEASTRLIELSGGVEQFISSMSGFISNFATEAQQFEIAQNSLTSAFEQANLSLPETRQGYYDLLQAQDGSTAAGAENIASILRLQSAASDYYQSLEDGAESALKAQRDAAALSIQSQKDNLSELASNQSAALSQSMALDEIVRGALGGLTAQSAGQSQEGALQSILRMNARGSVGGGSDLRGTVSAATNINAADFATFNDYIKSVSKTGAALSGLQDITGAKVTKDQQLLANIEKQMAVMSKELIALSEANVKQTAKSARILERIEIGGIEIKE